MTLTDIVIFALVLIILGLVMALHYRMQDASWYKAKWFTNEQRNKFLEARHKVHGMLTGLLHARLEELQKQSESRQQQLKEKAYRAQIKRQYKRNYDIASQPQNTRLAGLSMRFMEAKSIYFKYHKAAYTTNSFKRRLQGHVRDIKQVKALQS